MFSQNTGRTHSEYVWTTSYEIMKAASNVHFLNEFVPKQLSKKIYIGRRVFFLGRDWER